MSLLTVGVPAAGILGGIGVPELLIILVVVLLIFGPKNLPKLGSAIGRTVKGVREGLDGVNAELDEDKIEEIKDVSPKSGKKNANAKSGKKDVSSKSGKKKKKSSK